ncbi:MAG: tRNA (adenosine(37)-N6)-threonylcarbamoyltransferase complex transferase subunit TsaD [Thermoleophilia bacterium]
MNPGIILEGEGILLALETSCDDTSAALMDPEGRVLSSVVHSQDVIHEKYGGVVPEVAGRAHVERVTVVVREALEQAGVSLEQVERVAVTVGPGLIGALLVGVNSAKALAWGRRLPLIPVHHLHGHLAAVWLSNPSVRFPMVTLVASGGHTMLIRVDDSRTYRILGQTLDDAAGEAMDKGARLLGLGYPGGRELDLLAEEGDPEAFAFPIGLDRPGNLDFSFSGVKTAVYYLLRDLGEEGRRARRADVAASYRRAVVAALMSKLLEAGRREGVATLALAGGVAANSLLRRRLEEEAPRGGFEIVIPPLRYCTDNAAMIAAAARSGPVLEYPRYEELEAAASLTLGHLPL